MGSFQWQFNFLLGIWPDSTIKSTSIFFRKNKNCIKNTAFCWLLLILKCRFFFPCQISIGHRIKTWAESWWRMSHFLSESGHHSVFVALKLQLKSLHMVERCHFRKIAHPTKTRPRYEHLRFYVFSFKFSVFTFWLL